MANKFEVEVRNGLKQFEHCFFYSKFFDNPFAFQTNPFDFFVISKEHGAHAIECKYSQNDIFNLARVKEHQKDALLLFKKNAGYSWILICLRSKEKTRVWRLSIDEFIEIKETFRKKSLNSYDFEELKIAEIKRVKYHLENNTNKNRVVYGWDMSWILGYSWSCV